jgi:hypothetical protein
MGIINSMFAKWQKHQQGEGNNPNVQIGQNSSPDPSPPVSQPSLAMQRYTELEAELTRSPQIVKAKNKD